MSDMFRVDIILYQRLPEHYLTWRPTKVRFEI